MRLYLLKDQWAFLQTESYPFLSATEKRIGQQCKKIVLTMPAEDSGDSRYRPAVQQVDMIILGKRTEGMPQAIFP